MASCNKTKKPEPIYTAQGGKADRVSKFEELQRTAAACLLWEDGFYESGDSIAARIALLVPQCDEEDLNMLVVQMRTVQHLRHAPLWIMVCMAKCGKLKANVLCAVIQRADEIAEFFALYQRANSSQR